MPYDHYEYMHLRRLKERMLGNPAAIQESPTLGKKVLDKELLKGEDITENLCGKKRRRESDQKQNGEEEIKFNQTLGKK